MVCLDQVDPSDHLLFFQPHAVFFTAIFFCGYYGLSNTKLPSTLCVLSAELPLHYLI